MYSKAAVTLICSLLVLPAFANEEAAPAPAVPERRTTEASYAEVLAKVSALEAKVRSAEAEIENLIEEKQHTKDKKRAEEIISQMVKLHHQMQANVKEYDQQRSLLKYRYPEKSGAEKREYERIEVKTLNEMEDAMSLSSSVNKTLKKVRTQYKSVENPARAEKAVKPGKKKGEPAVSDLTEPVILKK